MKSVALDPLSKGDFTYSLLSHSLAVVPVEPIDVNFANINTVAILYAFGQSCRRDVHATAEYFTALTDGWAYS
jgi:hypothetical protein